jgi:hypothetical protein
MKCESATTIRNDHNSGWAPARHQTGDPVIPSSSGDVAQVRHDEIARLEGEIEALAERIERCRRIILGAKVAIAGGAVLLLALVVGLVPFNPTAMIFAMAAVIGGIVAFGSNTTTARQAAADMSTAQAQRDLLIGRMHLRVVGLPDA